MSLPPPHAATAPSGAQCCAPPHGIWLSELGNVDYPLDARYPMASALPVYMPPKFDYMWKATKLRSLDPKPGTPGYFATLARIAMESHIANAAEIRTLVSEGQQLFKAMGATQADMDSAIEAAKRDLLQTTQTLDAAWQAIIRKTCPLHAPNGDGWQAIFKAWLELRVELAAVRGEASGSWTAKADDQASALERQLMGLGFEREAFPVLREAIDARVKGVACAYTNEFAQLYQILGNTEAVQTFRAFEKGLSTVLPHVACAPMSAPHGRGRNARLGVAPCADVIVRIATDNAILIGLIVPQDDQASMKMLGGKRDPHFRIADSGELCIEVDSAQETAVKEFLEESGADAVGRVLHLDRSQLALLDALTPSWRTTLQALDVHVDGNKVTWSANARAALENDISARLQQVSPELPVPDVRTSKHAGYCTIVFEANVDSTDESQRRLLTLLLTVQGGDDAAHFGFRASSEVRMQSTHKQIFADYMASVAYVVPDVARANTPDGQTLRTLLDADGNVARMVKIQAAHAAYLRSQGLLDRADRTSVVAEEQACHLPWRKDVMIRRVNLHETVKKFDPRIKNTLLTTAPDSVGNAYEDVRRVLDIRLPPLLKSLLREVPVEVFLGSSEDLRSWYMTQGGKILCTFNIASSAKYTLGVNDVGEYRLFMEKLVSRDNMISQLLTLKLAGVPMQNVSVIEGSVGFKQQVADDLDDVIAQLGVSTSARNLLLVMGRGGEKQMLNALAARDDLTLSPGQEINGRLFQLRHFAVRASKTNCTGVVAVSIPFGEIAGDMVAQFIKKARCRYVLCAGSGGYIPSEDGAQNEPIGAFVLVGEQVALNLQDDHSDAIFSASNIAARGHISVASPLLETYDWLKAVRAKARTVDVETADVVRAIQRHNEENPADAVLSKCGVFVSDRVGETPLRSMLGVFDKSQEILDAFMQSLTREERTPDA